MTLERIAGICFCIVITSAVANGQQRSETADQGPQGPGRSVIERTYAAATSPPSDACKHEANPAAGKSSSKPWKCRTLKAG